MATESEKLNVSINERDSVTALIYPAAKGKRLGSTLILGHGAGANQLSGFMRLFADGLAARGCDVVTFNFVYMEQGRHVPDKNDKLEDCFRRVIDGVTKHKKLKGNRLAIGGKSMGGRIASQVAAKINDAPTNVPISALVLLGYPLHPPGRPEKLRDAHLKDIQAPMLFIQGSRDTFGTADELRATIKQHRLAATLHVIEGGDHSFKVRKASGVPQAQVYENMMDTIAAWLKTNEVS
jgi:predicted alpha/beta-hydrolase family hydrolase